MAGILLATALSALVRLTHGLASTDTITWGGDNSRTGYQTNHNMDPSIVGSSDFAQIFKTQLPGNYNGAAEQIFSQPLVYTPSNDTTQYVYFATTQNNVYKLDAKTGTILASRNLHIPFLTADLDGCVDVNPCIGVTATGVIDPDTDTLYLTAKTYVDQNGGTAAQGRPNGRYYVHAIDTNDLSERANFPVDLEGTVARNNPVRSFNGGIQHQRPGLLHVGQYVYFGFASHCVQYNFTGWIMGVDKTSGAIVERWATEGEGVPNTTPGGGIWMSGGGLASDGKGSMFFATGNGYASQLSTVPVAGRSPPTSLEEAAVHMSINDDGSLTVVDFFMPQEKQALDGADRDLGTSPLELLPSEFSCGDISRIGVVTGKNGKTYWLNLDDLGGYRTGTDSGDRVIQVYQNENSVYAGAGVYPLEGGYIYINVIQYPSHVFKFSCTDGTPSFTKVADSPESNAYILGVSHGTVTSLNGEAGTGLVWTTDVQGENLRIYNAVPENGYLTKIRGFSVPGTTKFTRAVFGDGRVYMGTTLGYVYGFGAPTTLPLNCTASVQFGTLDIEDASLSRTINCKAVIDVTVDSLTLNSSDFSVSSVPTFPLTLATGASLSFEAIFDPSSVGALTNTIVLATTNDVTGYSKQTSVLLKGTGASSGPLLSISPTTLTFSDVVLNATTDGQTQSVVISNNGNSSLAVSEILYSLTSATGPWVTPTSSGNGSKVGDFILSGMPSTIAANGAALAQVNFNPTTSGNFTLFVAVHSDGGNQTFKVTANAGPPPVWLMEFQTPDKANWVAYQEGVNFTFGNVTENDSKSLLVRITNNGTSGAMPLSLTVSKIPFGVSGIINAANGLDLAEGTVLEAGESKTTTMYCSPPKAQWNTDAYYGSAVWTMNTNDPNWDKQYIQFSCRAVAEQAPPLQADGDGVYRYVGCFKENNPGRQLTTQLYGSANNTISMCIAACAAGGYTYCGTQYQSECWGGPKIPTQRAGEDDCNYACAGNLNQICGGNGVGEDAGLAFMSLFATEGADTNSSTTAPGDPVINPGDHGFVSIDCYHEPTDGRALSNQLSVTNQTVDACLLAAAQNGYTYAGLEYGGECWAGNTLNSGATVANGSCTMLCNGNSSEYCGGASLLNMYKSNGTAVLPSNVVVVTPTGGPVVNPGVDGYTSLGCYHEPSDSRALTNQLSVSNQTVGICLAAAAAKGYKYVGLEYGGECWANNVLNSEATTAASSACSMVCNGNSSEYCGGSSLLNLYVLNSTTGEQSNGVASISPSKTTTSAAATATAGPATNPGVGGYAWIGCYHEPADSRALPYQLPVSNKTVAVCLAAADAGGYTYAGIEYGGECWAGNTLSDAANKTETSACSMVCNDNSTEYCGGSLLLDVYQLNGNTSKVAFVAASEALPEEASSLSSAAVSSTAPSSSLLTTSFAANSSTIFSTTSLTASSTVSVVSTTSTPSPTFSTSSSFSSSSSSISSLSSSSSNSSSASSSSASSSSSSSSSTSPSFSSSSSSSLSASSSLSSSSLSASSLSSSSSTPTSLVSSTPSPTSTRSTSSTSSTSSSETSSSLTSLSSSETPTSTSTSSSVTPFSSLFFGPSAPTGTAEPVVVLGNVNFTIDGCYEEPSSGTLLSQLVVKDATSLTVEKCLSECWEYAYAGVQNGTQCYCGGAISLASNSKNGTAGRAVQLTSCESATCTGNQTEYCGGLSQLLVYNQTVVV